MGTDITPERVGEITEGSLWDDRKRPGRVIRVIALRHGWIWVRQVKPEVRRTPRHTVLRHWFGKRFMLVKEADDGN